MKNYSNLIPIFFDFHRLLGFVKKFLKILQKIIVKITQIWSNYFRFFVFFNSAQKVLIFFFLFFFFFFFFFFVIFSIFPIFSRRNLVHSRENWWSEFWNQKMATERKINIWIFTPKLTFCRYCSFKRMIFGAKIQKWAFCQTMVKVGPSTFREMFICDFGRLHVVLIFTCPWTAKKMWNSAWLSSGVRVVPSE